MIEDTKSSLHSIEAALKDLRAALNEQILRLEQTFKTSSGDIISKVAERKAFAKKLELDKRLTEIWEEIRYYPGLYKHQDWPKNRLCEIDNPQSDKRENELEITFVLNSHPYRFIYRDEGGKTDFEGEHYHHARLSLHDVNVLIEIHMSVERIEFGSILEPFDVSAFIPGVWVQDFLECYERFQANKKARDIARKYDPSKIDDLKRRFGLGSYEERSS